MKKKVELLAPAGSIESFYAAVNSGADSVYLGGKSFNARQNSQNFDNDEMMDIVRYAHNKNVKIYVTLNTVLKDAEIVDALNYAVFLYLIDVDAVIVQDLGLLYLIRKYIPELNVNMSTQAVVYDEYGVNFFEKFNPSKVILARELSIPQIKEIVKNTKTDLEVFIHGALCNCYSGQCYMSSFLGGRSGNRGKCAQPCRLNYSFFDKDKGDLIESLEETPLLSLKDFKAGESIHDLIDAGIKAVKIEGRMKGPEYTSSVVEYYRYLIDNYDNLNKGNLNQLENKAISTFSRGYTNAYLKQDADDEMFARTSSGVKGSDIDEIVEGVKEVAHEFSEFNRREIEFEITLKIGEKAVLTANDGKNKAVIKSKEDCETSEKNPASDEIIAEQLSKLGNTIYKLKNINIIKDTNVFVRKSTLNQMRRDATEELYEKGAYVHTRPDMEELSENQIFNFTENKKHVKPSIALKINKEEEIELIDPLKVKRIYVPYDMDFEVLKNINVEKYLYIPNIVSKAQYAQFEKSMTLYQKIFDGVCVNNVGTFEFFKEKSNLKIHCGPYFNLINTFSAELLKEQGAEGFTFSVEANIKDIQSVMKNTDIKSEIIAHQYVQMMVMKNCPMSVIKNCKYKEDCNKCEYKEKISLKDRKGVYFNIERKNKLSHIYNSVPLTLIGKTDDFVRSNIDYYLVDTKWEQDIEDIIDALYCEINGVQTSNVLRENNFTRGHYLKNIL